MPLWSTTVLDPRYRWQLALFSSWGQRMDWIRVINIFWLVLQTFLFSISYMGCHPPHWLIFFKGVGIPPTSIPCFTEDDFFLFPFRNPRLKLQRISGSANPRVLSSVPLSRCRKVEDLEIWGKYHFYHAGKTFRHHFFLGFLYTRKCHWILW